MPNLETQVRRAISQINPDLAIINFDPFSEQVKANFTQQAMIAKLTSFFGILALILASIGLYGVTAYSVERRTSEIGIRMALGANRNNVLRMVLAQRVSASRHRLGDRDCSDGPGRARDGEPVVWGQGL